MEAPEQAPPPRADPLDPAEVKCDLRVGQVLPADLLEPSGPGVKNPALDPQPHPSGIGRPEGDDECLSYEHTDGVGRSVGFGLPDEQSEILI